MSSCCSVLPLSEYLVFIRNGLQKYKEAQARTDQIGFIYISEDLFGRVIAPAQALKAKSLKQQAWESIFLKRPSCIGILKYSVVCFAALLLVRRKCCHSRQGRHRFAVMIFGVTVEFPRKQMSLNSMNFLQ